MKVRKTARRAGSMVLVVVLVQGVSMESVAWASLCSLHRGRVTYRDGGSERGKEERQEARENSRNN